MNIDTYDDLQSLAAQKSKLWRRRVVEELLSLAAKEPPGVGGERGELAQAATTATALGTLGDDRRFSERARELIIGVVAHAREN